MEDGPLFVEMREAADALAGWMVGLDYSVESLDILDEALASADCVEPTTRDAGAYLGEVLLRHGGFMWKWPKHYGSERGDEPFLLTNSGLSLDVFSLVRQLKTRRRRDPPASLSLYASQVLEYASSPGKEIEERIGLKWKYKGRAHLDALRWDWQRFRARRHGG